MLSESGGCMCLNHRKNFGLLMVSFFCSAYSLIWCPEGGIVVSFFVVLGALSAVCVVLEGPGNMLDF